MLRASVARLILAMVVGLAAAPIALGQDVPSAIRVVGNKRVEAAMVRSYFHAEKGDGLSRADLDSAVKALYATGYFERVDLSRSGAELVVTVVENSFIDRIGLEGNRKLKDEAIRKELRSRERAPLVRANVHEDVLQIQELYRRTGRFNVAVNPKLIEHKDNRVDL